MVSVDTVEDVAPEYAATAERYFGPEQGKAWVDQLRAMMKGWDEPMLRIRMSPVWANVIDFQTRFPSALGI